jgi:hypothetical protein
MNRIIFSLIILLMLFLLLLLCLYPKIIGSRARAGERVRWEEKRRYFILQNLM